MGARDKATTPWVQLWNTAIVALMPGEDMEHTKKNNSGICWWGGVGISVKL